MDTSHILQMTAHIHIFSLNHTWPSNKHHSLSIHISTPDFILNHLSVLLKTLLAHPGIAHDSAYHLYTPVCVTSPVHDLSALDGLF